MPGAPFPPPKGERFGGGANIRHNEWPWNDDLRTRVVAGQPPGYPFWDGSSAAVRGGQGSPEFQSFAITGSHDQCGTEVVGLSYIQFGTSDSDVENHTSATRKGVKTFGPEVSAPQFIRRASQPVRSQLLRLVVVDAGEPVPAFHRGPSQAKAWCKASSTLA